MENWGGRKGGRICPSTKQPVQPNHQFVGNNVRFKNCLGLNLNWKAALTLKRGARWGEKIVRDGRTERLLTEGKNTHFLFYWNSWISWTHTHTHVSDSITALWDEGEILQPSALPIKLLLYVFMSASLCVTACTCMCVTVYCVCLTGEVCVYGSRLWWRGAALQGSLKRDEWGFVCVRVSLSDVTLYHFRLISPILIEAERGREQDADGEQKKVKTTQGK